MAIRRRGHRGTRTGNHEGCPYADRLRARGPIPASAGMTVGERLNGGVLSLWFDRLTTNGQAHHADRDRAGRP